MVKIFILSLLVLFYVDCNSQGIVKSDPIETFEYSSQSRDEPNYQALNSQIKRFLQN